MAQDGCESSSKASSSASAGSSGCSTPFRFNVHAREFVPAAGPMGAGALAAAGYYPPFLQLPGGGGGGGGVGLGAADWSFLAEPDPTFFLPDFGHAEIAGAAGITGHPKGASPADIKQVWKTVEYQFSDTNLVANDFLTKIMNKDPEGYVPLSVISSWKKIKAMGVTNQLLVRALRTSEKLVVSDDGRRVRRAQPFTERHKEELQSRMVIAENLPDDSTRNSLEKIFGVIGSVKNIRICHPQEPSSSRSSKPDANPLLVSNKLHALIEYETSQQADRAVDKLNDGRNWRKGLRVRAVLRRPVTEASPHQLSPDLWTDHWPLKSLQDKPATRLKRPDLDHLAASDEERSPDSPTPAAARSPDHSEDQHAGARKPWGRGRGRPHAAAAAAGAAAHLESLAAAPRHAAQGPRMPDGTRGFTMGRGRPPLAVAAAAAAVRVV
ncbi:la-related protein 6C-like [Panicum virgatum]|uniref:la-related protein 6C-like n=1 Tax=Panicum virgatum TaxID=38727 RepID=UPI0019D61824|nr:la-related protein 6C-like [Panicum virgatum]